MTARRDFLKLSAAGVIQAGPRHLDRARKLVRSGALGRLVFCRVGDAALLAVVERVTSGCIIEVDPAFQGAAFLGSRATLVIDRAGCHLFRDIA